MRQIALLLIFFSFSFGYSQSPADWWFFGDNAGMHFTLNGPVSDPNGQISTDEGCASISDPLGNLLFYSDGIDVFDANHNQMPNGFGLLGDGSSTQSAVIYQKPGAVDSFYIFTIDDGVGPNGLRYSLVDMNLNGGLGDVVSTEKNVLMLNGTAEKICVVNTSNGAWVLTHKLPGDSIFAYEVTSAGVNLTPVISMTGLPLSTANFFGYMRSSVQGDKIAFASQNVAEITLADFDKNTGQVSNAISISQSINSTFSYAVEFSPNGKLLYVMSYNSADVRQYNIELSTASAISNSEVILGSQGTGGGALQLGPDCRIYAARFNQNFISVIENPDILGLGAGFIDTALILSPGTTSRYGFPTFAQACNALFYDSLNCVNDSTYFILDTTDIDFVNWDFDDPATGVNNVSTDFFPAHLFNDTGLFTVKLIYQAGGAIDSIFRTIRIYPRQSISLPSDTSICDGDSIRLGVTQPYASYLWDNGSTSDSITIAGDTLVMITVTGVCDTVSATVNILYDDSIVFDLGPDTAVCVLDSYTIVSGITQNAVIQWSTGQSTPDIRIGQSGNFEMNAVNACGSLTDNVTVTLRSLPVPFNLPADTSTCLFDPIEYTVPLEAGLNYLWSNGDTGSSASIDTTGQVWLQKSNDCGTVSDTVNALFNGVQVDLGNDTTICDFDSLALNAFNTGAEYIWSTDDTSSIVMAHTEGQNYSVTVTKGACSDQDAIRIDYSEIFCEDISCTLTTENVFSPNGDGINDIWRATTDCNIQQFSLEIYNRWGQMVHFSSNAVFGWDGYNGSEPAPEGTYYFVLEFADNVVVDVDRQVFQGSIMLFRN